MTKRKAFWIFFLGTLSSTVLFLFLTYDTHRQVDVLTHVDRLSEDVIAGKRVWERSNCNDCHTILGFGSYYAPDMTKVYRRIGEAGIVRAVSDPEDTFRASWRKMPAFDLTEQETKELVSFLKWVSEIDNNDWPPQDSDQKIARSALRLAGGVGVGLGAALFKEKGCIACHHVGGVGGTLGPALDHVGSHHSRDELKKLVRDPKSVNPNATMPAQSGLSDAELTHLIDFLLERK